MEQRYEYQVIHRWGDQPAQKPIRQSYLVTEDGKQRLVHESDEEYEERTKDWVPPLTLTDTLNQYATAGWRVLHLNTRLERDEWVAVFERPIDQTTTGSVRNTP